MNEGRHPLPHLADCEYALVLRRIARTIGLREGFSFEALEGRVRSLVEALDWIEAEPEDPAKVQARARAALRPGPTSIRATLEGRE